MIISRRFDSFTFTGAITRHLRRLLKSNQHRWPSVGLIATLQGRRNIDVCLRELATVVSHRIGAKSN